MTIFVTALVTIDVTPVETCFLTWQLNLFKYFTNISILASFSIFVMLFLPSNAILIDLSNFVNI